MRNPVRRNLPITACALLCASAGAQPLGTLLHSAAERAQLDAPERPATSRQDAALPAQPTVTGFVRRSDGRATVFFANRTPEHLIAPFLSTHCSHEARGIFASELVVGAEHCASPLRDEATPP